VTSRVGSPQLTKRYRRRSLKHTDWRLVLNARQGHTGWPVRASRPDRSVPANERDPRPVVAMDGTFPPQKRSSASFERAQYSRMLLGMVTDPVARAIWYIEAHLSSDYSLAVVAEAAGVSRFYLSRAFGEATGRSVMRYVRGRRLSEAARALLAGAPDILSVALDSGYQSHEAFTRAFSDQFGITPQTLRARGQLETISLVEPIRRDFHMAINVQMPRIEKGRLLLLAGLAERFDFGTVQRIPLLWQRFAPFIGSVPGQVGYTTYGVSINGDDEGFDYEAAVEVESLERLPQDLKGLRIPAQTYAVFMHAGHVSALRNTMNAIWSEWLPASKLTTIDAPNFERYTDQFDPQSGNGIIEVWIPVQP